MTPHRTALTAALALLAGCTTGAKGGDGLGGGDSANFADDPCLAASDYLAACALPATEAEYDACQASLADIEAACDAEARSSYEAALSSLYACLSAAGYCVGDDMTEAAFLCQADFADATAPMAGCQP